MNPPVVVAIPARYASTRLPGKPLVDLAGRPMILHVVERARALIGARVLVATDDARIHEVVTAAGAEALLTRPSHLTGSDRLAEVVERLELPDQAIVVNLQGDEPLMPVSCLAAVVQAAREDLGAAAATLATPIDSVDEFCDPACVKVVLDEDGRALYFSRAPIPWPRDLWAGEPAQLPTPRPWRHLGLYAYRALTLREFSRLAPGRLERVESLEQLRLLENRLAIAVRPAPEAIPPGVDTPADVIRVAALMAGPTALRARRVLFVCMGNICRSPLAEAYARLRFRELGLDVEVASAGTIGHHRGAPADAGALQIAARAGLDLTSHRARRVRDEDFQHFDLILALDDRNLADLQARSRKPHAARLGRLLDFARGCGHREVPDPYGQSLSAFAHSLALIREGVDGLAEQLAAGT